MQRLVRLPLTACSLLVFPLLPEPAAQTLTTAGAVARFAPDPVSGVPGLDAIGDAREASAFRFALSTPIWSLEFKDASGNVAIVDPTVLSAGQSSVVVHSATRLTLRWTGCASSRLTAGETFDVAVDAELLPGDDSLELDIAVTTRTPSHSLRVVEFPRLDIGSRGSIASQVLTWPYVAGWLLPAPLTNVLVRNALAGSRLPMPGSMSMQWFSYYDTSERDAAVLFFGTRDARGHYKEITVETPRPAHLPIRLRQVPAGIARDNDYASPYPFVLRVLRGDWYDAARYYRRWGLTQPWAQSGPMRTSATFSRTIRDARLFSANSFRGTQPSDFGRFAYWPGTIEDQASWFDVPSLPNLQYRWYRALILGNGGDWLPMHAEYAAAGHEVRRNGDRHAPYFFNLFYNTTLPSYLSSYVPGHVGRPVEPNGLMREDGQRLFATLDTGDRALELCPTPPFMRDYTLHIADVTRREAGAQGIYLDYFTVDDASTCYDPAHGHPLGGGDHYIQSKLAQLDALRTAMRAHEPDWYVISESPSEMFLGRVELTYAHNTNPGPMDPALLSIAPLFDAVYGDHVVTTVVGPPILDNEGGYHGDYEIAFRRFCAVNIYLGHAPWVGALFSADEFDEIVPEALGLTRIYTMLERYVSLLRRDVVHEHFGLGERLRDPRADVVRVTPVSVDADYLVYDRDQPVVYTTAWRAAGRDGAGFLLLNWTAWSDRFPTGGRGGDALVVVHVDLPALGLAPGRFRLIETTRRGDVQLGEVQLSGSTPVPITVPAVAARFLRIERAP